MLQTFSRTLIELYESAEAADVAAFPSEVIRLLGRLVSFDGSVLGMGDSAPPGAQRLEIHNALVHGRDQGIVAEYASVSLVDPMTHRFLAGLREPLCGSTSAIAPGKQMDELRAFHDRHDLEHLLLFGKPSQEQSPARWLVLYRGAGDAFDHSDSQHLGALWPHLERAIWTNRSRFLHSQSPSYHRQGAALISSGACIEVAEPLFRALCALEWPAGVGRRIPDAVWNCWRRGLDYVGKKVQFKMLFQHDGFIVAQATAIGPLALLTPQERIVATKFASGLSAKAVAKALGLSAHTVRSHLAQVYGKLNVHDKAELASLMLGDRGH
ncbi:MAG: hypothetical protein NVS2B4_18610 [Ramlibacter sp.]